MSSDKPSFHHRSALTRKGQDEEHEDDAKPTLNKRSSGSKMPSRAERILQGIAALADDKLQVLTTRISADELAVALLDADQATKTRIAGLMAPEQQELFNQYLAMGKEKLPSSVIDGVQGKLLRLI